MKKLFVILVFFISGSTSPVFSSGTSIRSVVSPDQRIEILRTFLSRYDSPLTSYAAEFVEAADFYGIDWKLVPAITGVESTFGKFTPEGSYNAYGWNNGNYRFFSWEDSIWQVTKTLKTKYFDRGVATIAQIARVYAPPSDTWGKNVTFFVNKLQNTSALAFNP